MTMVPSILAIFILATLQLPGSASVQHRQPIDAADDDGETIVTPVDDQGAQGPVHMVSTSSNKDDGEKAAPTSSSEHAAAAKEAASVAKQAAKVANKVAEHSVNVTKHAKKALKHALGALHDARVETEGLNTDQKTSLKKAEAQLREATKKAEYGRLKKVKDAKDEQKDKMQASLDTKDAKSEKEELLQRIEALRQKLSKKQGDNAYLEEGLDALEKTVEGADDAAVDDEVKADLDRIADIIDKLEDRRPTLDEEPPTPVQEKGIDVDTAMPYGELEPFGREDTAQELTEGSVRESDEMVDQLERAEVAEEKRAVFRALTRLRGAAITSFDGVARAQTGNIDEYGKTHKWRQVHPLHHLADEESDISKWAFPDNADFIQMKP